MKNIAMFYLPDTMGYKRIQEVSIMQKLIPHLWYDKEAVEAAELYVKLFEDSRITALLK